MTLSTFNKLPKKRQKALLFDCCGSTSWVKSMLSLLPISNLSDLLDFAEEEWYDCNTADWLETFENHSRCGRHKNDVPSGKIGSLALPKQYDSLTDDDDVVDDFTAANAEYEEVFGYQFITASDTKPVSQRLSELRERLYNDPREEIKVAADEQFKIIRKRLETMFAKKPETVALTK